jgi:hypothetical protein
VDLIRRLEDHGLVVHLVARLRVSPNPVATWRAWQRRHFLGPNRIEVVRGQIRGRVQYVPLWNLMPGLSLPRPAGIVGPPPGSERRVVLHTRQIVMARLGLSLKRLWPRLRVIAELEGDDLAEIEYKESKAPRPSSWARLRRGLERHYYHRAYRRILRDRDAVTCVSNNLRDVLIRRYSLTEQQARKLHVIPTFASRKEFCFLCAGDVGLLLRERHRMNEVAAPGKFGEHTLSGLPIVMTEGMGDFSARMRDSEWACVLPGLDDADGMRERIQRFCSRDFTADERTAFSRWAAERFASELCVPQFAAPYTSV